jgi:hypothetical protein
MILGILCPANLLLTLTQHKYELSPIYIKSIYLILNPEYSYYKMHYIKHGNFFVIYALY